MLEIIALIFLTKNMGALAQKKGLKPGTWKFYTVLCWFGAEILGAILFFMILGEDSLYIAVLLGMVCAVGSYFILRTYLKNRPDADDSIDEDINRIGVSDLYPEKLPK
ncbi:MAG: hypothetical protein ABIN74_13785 [Ferruginibacter sp.]